MGKEKGQDKGEEGEGHKLGVSDGLKDGSYNPTHGIEPMFLITVNRK